MTLLPWAEGCTIPLKDNEFCADAGSAGAYCFHSLSKGQRHVEKVVWDTERFGQICETTATFANLKEVIETLCANTNQCTYQQLEMERQFYSRMQVAVKRK